MSFDYYYKEKYTNENSDCWNIPRDFVEAEKFSSLTDSDLIVYSLMLERMELSLENGWYDDKNRLYIIFTIQEIMESRNYGKDKVIRILNRLEKNGIIIRNKQKNKSLIYVMIYN